MTKQIMTQDVWQHLTEEAERGFQEQIELDKKALRRKRMINRIEGILIAVIAMIIFRLLGV